MKTFGKKAPVASGGRNQFPRPSYPTRPAVTTPPAPRLSPRRKVLAEQVLEALQPWQEELDAVAIASRIGAERSDVLLAVDDLWMLGRINMQASAGLGFRVWVGRASL